MQSEDQYLERTPDLVAKVRAMRQAAEKEMNRFTQFSDYDVRRVVGQKPKEPVASGQTATNPEPAEIPAWVERARIWRQTFSGAHWQAKAEQSRQEPAPPSASGRPHDARRSRRRR